MARTKISLAPLLPTSFDMDFFVNRDSEVDQLKRAIDQGLNAIVIGDYGSGKTTMLNRMLFLYQKKSDLVLFFVSLPLEIRTVTDFIEVLLAEMARKIRDLPDQKLNEYIGSTLTARRTEIQFSRLERERNRDSSLVSQQYDSLNAFVDTTAAILNAGKTPIFLIDETDKIPETFYAILSNLRESLWRTKATFIFSGDQAEEDLYRRPPVNSFLDVTVKLKPFNNDSVERLLRSRIENVSVTPHTIEAVRVSTGGNPGSILQMVRDVYLAMPTTGNLPLDLNIDHVIPLSKGGLLTSPNKSIAKLDFASKGILRYLDLNGATSASDSRFQTHMQMARPTLVLKLKRMQKMNLVRSTYEKKTRRRLYSVMPPVDSENEKL